MGKSPEKRQLTLDEREECARLKRAWLAFQESERQEGRDWSQDSFVEGLDFSQSNFSHYLNGIQALNHKALSAIAKKMRIDPLSISRRLGLDLAVPEHATTKRGDALIVPQFDAEGSMGWGSQVADYDEVVDHIALTREWVGKHLTISRAENLAVISGIGNSMSPTFNGGDLMLVDRGISEVRVDSIYVFTYKGELFIKTLQRRPGGGLRAISDNKTYDSFDITSDDDGFAVLGRVVWAWNGKKI